MLPRSQFRKISINFILKLKNSSNRSLKMPRSTPPLKKKSSKKLLLWACLILQLLKKTSSLLPYASLDSILILVNIQVRKYCTLRVFNTCLVTQKILNCLVNLIEDDVYLVDALWGKLVFDSLPPNKLFTQTF